MSRSHATVTITLVALITIIAFESLAISTVMPAAAAELGAGTRYGLAFSSMVTAQLLGIVVAGAWIGRVGPVLPTWLGQALFAAGSLAAGLAPSFELLLAGRVVAGLGAGLVVVALYVVVGSAYPESARPRVFAWMSAAWVLPSIIGPLLAALLAQVWSWRAVFLVVVPAVALTAAGLFANRRRLGAGRSEGSGTAGRDADVTGPTGRGPARTTYPSARRTVWLGLAVAAGAALFQWAGTDLVPPRPLYVGGALLGLVVLGLAARPLLPPGTGRLRRGLPAVVAARFALAASFNGAMTYVPLMLVAARGLQPSAAGAVLALASIGWTAGAWLQGRPRFDPRHAPVLAAGGACVTAGLAGLAATAATGAPIAVMIVSAAALGLGMGLGTTAVSVLVLHLAPPSQHAQASSAMSLSDALGATVGLATAGTLYATLVTDDPATSSDFAWFWAATAVVGVLALVAGVRSTQRART